MNKGQHINIIDLEFVSYASISLKIEVCADNLFIEWGDGKIEELKSDKGCYYIHKCFDTEGLRRLKLVGEQITYFKASRIGLIEISLQNCNALKYLDCSYNELLGLDISDCTSLEELYCCNNNILFFRIPSPSRLSHLNISNNNLQELYLNNCKDLKYLDCQNNKIKELDITKCLVLTELNIKENLIDEISFKNLDFSSIYSHVETSCTEKCGHCQQKFKK